MRILFAALHPGYYRNVDSVIDELARRGHQVHLGFERRDAGPTGEMVVRRLAGQHPDLTYGAVPPREPEPAFLAGKIRLGLDYLRYLDPVYPASSFLPSRARWRTPAGVVRLTGVPGFRSRPARHLMARTLDSVDRALPPSPAIERFLDEQRPDMVVITPLIGLVASSQLDLLRSAQARRLPTVVIVWSWDHLSSKAVIRDVPDALFVWNDAQKQEAVAMHGVPAGRIVVTGAQCFDRWFGRAPVRMRDDFLRHVGLRPDRPYIMWACSALLPGGPPEPELVLRWARQIRTSADSRLREAGILIRPHPSRLSEWESSEWRGIGNVALYGGNPVEDEARSDYFDSLYHSAAVAGITTSAFIDAAVVGRPVLTVFFDEVRHEHEGSLHFQHLLKFAGGLVTAARSLEEHERQLGAMIDGPPQEVAVQQRIFVRAFVRPHGLDTPATGIVADALERIGASPQAAARSASSLTGRVGLRLLQAAARHHRWRYLLLNEREARETAQREEALARKAAIRAEKARVKERRARAQRTAGQRAR